MSCDVSVDQKLGNCLGIFTSGRHRLRPTSICIHRDQEVSTPPDRIDHVSVVNDNFLPRQLRNWELTLRRFEDGLRIVVATHQAPCSASNLSLSHLSYGLVSAITTFRAAYPAAFLAA